MSAFIFWPFHSNIIWYHWEAFASVNLCLFFSRVIRWDEDFFWILETLTLSRGTMNAEEFITPIPQILRSRTFFFGSRCPNFCARGSLLHLSLFCLRTSIFFVCRLVSIFFAHKFPNICALVPKFCTWVPSKLAPLAPQAVSPFLLGNLFFSPLCGICRIRIYSMNTPRRICYFFQTTRTCHVFWCKRRRVPCAKNGNRSANFQKKPPKFGIFSAIIAQLARQQKIFVRQLSVLTAIEKY